jgi:hypothetical protein
MGNPGRSLYSTRFPEPIFYLIEITWPYSDVHPISLLLYIVGLVGLGLFVWRHKKEDKFVFIWFIIVLVFFTLISNRQWRYVLTLFPALAISASVAILFAFDKIRALKGNRKRAAKVAGGLLIAFLAVAMAFSIYDTYYVARQADINIPIQQATEYAMAHDDGNQSIMVLCPFNLFSQDMIQFYLWADDKPQIHTYQYPELAVDTYTPTFNISEFVSLCRQCNVKFVFTYEYGGTVPYFNTTLNLHDIYEQLYASGNFSALSDEATFGANPRRIFILTFLG